MAGYSGTPLKQKLGIKDHTQVVVLGYDQGYQLLFDEPVVYVSKLPSSEVSCVHIFATKLASMHKQVLAAKKVLTQNGMIWVSWYKPASKKSTEVNENEIRNFALQHGLVDIKVCAINEDWSGLKLVIPVALRTK
jgi:exosome complex RNA-binding protein Rrp4